MKRAKFKIDPKVPGIIESLRCPKHPRYRGIRKPAVRCKTCGALYRIRKEHARCKTCRVFGLICRS